MKPSQPYQPLLLRILHGLTGICLILAILTAFWTYNTYDGRWGQVPLPEYKAIEGVHGTFGLYTLLIFPAFVHYAFQRGQRRLWQPDSLAKLAQVGQPIWWYTLNRLTNTWALLALTLALFSGKMMDETWLPKGELNHIWYSVHLMSWVVMVVAIALHLLINAKIGGAFLLLSMWRAKFRAQDSPRLWPKNAAIWWQNVRQCSWAARFYAIATLPNLELAILGTLVAAWAISLLKELILAG